MAEHDFQPLLDDYGAVIAEMGDVFTSHEFILRLAQRNQPEYVSALSSYRDVTKDGVNAPFMVVHNQLSKHLRDFPELVEYVDQVASTDIFGHSNECAQWRKRR